MNNIVENINKKKLLYLIISIAILISLVFGYITTSFAMLEPIKSITIYSENTNYQNNDPGSFKIKKSAEWIERGKARITFNLDTVIKSSDKYKDIILVLDISGSMSGNKLQRVKEDSIELIDNTLSNPNNRIGLITFESSSSIVSELTNNKEELIDKINNLTASGCTNYYRALENVDNILKTYTKEDNREMTVLFLTDGYPNRETPNEEGEYKYLKDTYPYITLNGVQYEMGTDILEPIIKVSDNQYIANMETLNNVLFDATSSIVTYSNFIITDYIDTNYFNISTIDDIETSVGEVSLSGNKITWDLGNNFRSGNNATMTIDITLKDEYIDSGGNYPTNSHEEINSKIEENIENINSTETPVLATKYTVTYDGNLPENCSVNNIPNNENHSVFSTVKISDNKLVCEGYQFKGWKIVTEDVEKINDNHFIMPCNDVEIRGEWSKLAITKSMNGKVSKIQTLYNIMKEQTVLDNIKSTYVDSDTGIDFTNKSSDSNGKGIYTRAGTENDTHPIYYYRGNIDNNNILFADFCWKIVRTTETGGIKLIYNGTPNNGKCTNTTGDNTQLSTEVEFNNDVTNSLTYVGYMYGTIYNYSTTETTGWYYGNDVSWDGSNYTLKADSTNTYNPEIKNTLSGTSLNYYHYTCGSSTDLTCSSVKYVYNVADDVAYYITLSNGKKIEDAISEMLDNNNTDSTIKTAVDSWYRNNMTSYTNNYIEDTIYCNDRSIYDYNGWDPNGGDTTDFIYFGFNGRRNNPSVTCPRNIDKFTVSESIGNGKLSYPTGLLTADEAILAGVNPNSYNTYYLYTNNTYWLGSPYYYHYYYSSEAVVHKSGNITSLTNIIGAKGVRPVISLKPGAIKIEGDGTADDPYQIEMEEQ